MFKSLSITVMLFVLLFFNKNIKAQDEFFTPKTTVGGYGELHYNNVNPDNGNSTKTLDFHRFILFYSNSWTEKWSLKAEVELEHNIVESGQGALELEQAYLNYQANENIGFQIGVLLPSIGLINEYHEPPLFFGVERPEYDKVIIPTTWFGNGASIYGNFDEFSFKFVVMEGLNSDKFSAKNGIRKGRQDGFQSDASRFLYNARLDYLGFSGLRIGGSFTFNNAKGDSTVNRVIITELHGKYEANNIVAAFELGNINFNRGNIKDTRGYYVDLGYNVKDIFEIDSDLIPFFRYSDYNTAANTVSGGKFETQNHISKWMLGVSFKPIPSIVFKADYSVREIEFNNFQTKLFNFGVGYMF